MLTNWKTTFYKRFNFNFYSQSFCALSVVFAFYWCYTTFFR